jgi:NADH-quinone oxidoreductase subunit N
MLESISVNIADLNLITLSPMLLTAGGALLILLIDLIKPNLDKTLYVMLSLLVLFVDFGATLSLSINERGFFDVILIDGISIVSQLLILVASMLFMPLALTSKRFHEFSYPEFFALFLFMIAGFQFMVATDNLILIFIGLETASLSLYTLIAMHNTDASIEAAVKYFVMGAMAAAFFAMGAAVIYSVTGSVELYDVAKGLQTRIDEPGIMIPIIGGALLMLVAVGFKVSLMPFHLWTPDVYEGATSPMAGYMSIVPKLTMMVVAMRLLGLYVDMGIESVRIMIIILAVVTMTLANIMAIVQDDVKRMLAYSSISHAGFVMAALALDTTKAYSSIFLYYGLFLFTNLGAFSMLWISRSKNPTYHHRYHHPYSKFSGLVQTSPMAAVIMAIFMLSLTGVPPFSLFWGKLYVISSTVDAGYVWLAIIMALNSAIAAYYYLKLIIYMFLKPPVLDVKLIVANTSRPLMVMVGIAVVVTTLSVFFLQPVLSYITYMVSVSGY